MNRARPIAHTVLCVAAAWPRAGCDPLIDDNNSLWSMKPYLVAEPLKKLDLPPTIDVVKPVNRSSLNAECSH
jgi:hypothetical protein